MVPEKGASTNRRELLNFEIGKLQRDEIVLIINITIFFSCYTGSSLLHLLVVFHFFNFLSTLQVMTK